MAHTTPTYMTTEEAAQAVRTALKAKGLNARAVSVRKEYFSLGSSIEITIRDPSVSLRDVKSIAASAERIHRCEITGEILGGGNRYVSVRYSDEARKVLEAKHIDVLQPVADRLKAEPTGVGYEIPGTEFTLFRGHNGYGFALYADGSRVTEANDLATVSFAFAIAAQDRD